MGRKRRSKGVPGKRAKGEGGAKGKGRRKIKGRRARRTAREEEKIVFFVPVEKPEVAGEAKEAEVKGAGGAGEEKEPPAQGGAKAQEGGAEAQAEEAGKEVQEEEGTGEGVQAGEEKAEEAEEPSQVPEEPEEVVGVGYSPPGGGREPEPTSQERWVELRLPRGTSVRSLNLLGLWNTLYRLGETFDFVVGAYQSDRWKDRSSLRFFVGSTPEVVEHLKAVARSLGLRILDCSPPQLGEGLDLQMADYFGYLIAPPEKGPRPEDEEARVVRYSEELLSALSHGGAVWVRGRAEPRATVVIRRRGAAPPGDGWLKDLGRGMSGILPSIDGKRGEEIRRREMEQKRQAVEERKAFASLRTSEPLMVVGMRIMGTPEEISRIAAALPSPTRPGESSLQEYGRSSDPLPVPTLGGWGPALRKPAILLSFFLPFLLLSRAMGVFPFSLRIPGAAGMAVWILLPFLCALWVWARWKVWKPIVLSTRELATLFSFPVHPERFSLEFAEAPPGEEFLMGVGGP